MIRIVAVVQLFQCKLGEIASMRDPHDHISCGGSPELPAASLQEDSPVRVYAALCLGALGLSRVRLLTLD